MSIEKDPEARIRALEDIEAIKKVKSRYWRGIDRKQWDLIAETLTDDAVADYGGPSLTFYGKAAIINFLRDSFGPVDRQVVHHGHNPDIELTSDSSARGIWALNDIIWGIPESDKQYEAWCFYEDEYAREHGMWRIKSTRLIHLHRTINNRQR